MSDDSSAGEKLLFFLVGGMVGVAVGMLFAPKSGEETRADISRRVREGSDYLVNQKRVVEEKASVALDQGKEILNRQRESIAAAIEAGKQAYREERSKPEA